MRFSRLLTVAALSGSIAFATSCTPAPPPVSDKVAAYYEANKSLAPSETPKPAGPTVAFLGDSYTAGTGADPVALRWTSQLSGKVNWTEINQGQGGTGYASQGPTPPKTMPYLGRVPNFATDNPGVVVVSGGRNDLGVNPQQTAAGITDTFAAIRKSLPAAKIIALNPWWDDDPAPESLAAIGEQVKAAVESVGGVYVDAGQPLLGNPAFVVADGVHPNTAGHAAIAEAVAAALPAEFKAP